MPPVECLSTAVAVGRLRHCLEDGQVIPGKHFRDELAKEELALEDAWNVLSKGLIYDPPEPDIKTGEWKYRVEGYEPGDKWVAVVFSFKTPDRAFLITIFSMEARTRK
jgi:hypothetical protein